MRKDASLATQGKMIKNRKKILIFYVSAFCILLIGIILAGCVLEKKTMQFLLKEDFFQYVLIYPMILFFSYFDIRLLLIGTVLLTGISVPIIISVKKRKLFPYSIIYIFFLCLYLFLGLLIFGIRNGEFTTDQIHVIEKIDTSGRSTRIMQNIVYEETTKKIVIQFDNGEIQKIKNVCLISNRTQKRK